MSIKFEIDTDELTVEDFLLIEDAQDGNRPMHAMTGIMARFIAGEDGKLLEPKEGLRVLKAVKFSEFTAIAQQFAEAIQRKAIPPMRSAD